MGYPSISYKNGSGDRRAFEALLPAPPTYIVAFDERRRIVDVVKRYASSWAAVLKRTPARAWWQETLQMYARRYPNPDDHGEECAELDAFADDDAMPTKLDEFRNHPKYAIKKFLKKYEVIYPEDEILDEVKGHAVYSRVNLHTLHSRENWLREPMRCVREGEMPFKKVKVMMVAATAHCLLLNRFAVEIEEAGRGRTPESVWYLADRAMGS